MTREETIKTICYDVEQSINDQLIPEFEEQYNIELTVVEKENLIKLLKEIL